MDAGNQTPVDYMEGKHVTTMSLWPTDLWIPSDIHRPYILAKGDQSKASVQYSQGFSRKNTG